MKKFAYICKTKFEYDRVKSASYISDEYIKKNEIHGDVKHVIDFIIDDNIYVKCFESKYHMLDMTDIQKLLEFADANKDKKITLMIAEGDKYISEIKDNAYKELLERKIKIERIFQDDLEDCPQCLAACHITTLVMLLTSIAILILTMRVK